MSLSLKESGNGFLLSGTNSQGVAGDIFLSQEEFLGLKETIGLWTNRILSQRQAKSGSVQPIVVHPIAQARVRPEAIGENVLLTVEAPTGEQMTLSFSPLLAQHIANEISSLLANMPAKNPTKQ